MQKKQSRTSAVKASTPKILPHQTALCRVYGGALPSNGMELVYKKEVR